MFHYLQNSENKLIFCGICDLKLCQVRQKFIQASILRDCLTAAQIEVNPLTFTDLPRLANTLPHKAVAIAVAVFCTRRVPFLIPSKVSIQKRQHTNRLNLSSQSSTETESPYILI